VGHPRCPFSTGAAGRRRLNRFPPARTPKPTWAGGKYQPTIDKVVTVSLTSIRRIAGARRGWWVLVVVDGVLGVFTVAGYARFTVPLAGVLLVLAAPRGFRTALAALRRRGVGGAPPSAAPPPPARHRRTP